MSMREEVAVLFRGALVVAAGSLVVAACGGRRQRASRPPPQQRAARRRPQRRTLPGRHDGGTGRDDSDERRGGDRRAGSPEPCAPDRRHPASDLDPIDRGGARAWRRRAVGRDQGTGAEVLEGRDRARPGAASTPSGSLTASVTTRGASSRRWKSSSRRSPIPMSRRSSTPTHTATSPSAVELPIADLAGRRRHRRLLRRRRRHAAGHAPGDGGRHPGRAVRRRRARCRGGRHVLTQVTPDLCALGREMAATTMDGSARRWQRRVPDGYAWQPAGSGRGRSAQTRSSPRSRGYPVVAKADTQWTQEGALAGDERHPRPRHRRRRHPLRLRQRHAWRGPSVRAGRRQAAADRHLDRGQRAVRPVGELKATNPDFKIYYTNSVNWPPRVALQAAVDSLNGEEIPGALIYPQPFVLLEEGVYDPSKPGEFGASTLVPEALITADVLTSMTESVSQAPNADEATASSVDGMNRSPQERAPCAREGSRRAFPGCAPSSGVDLDCSAGEIHALVGENGSGKSTLIGVASGRLQADAGTVEIDGQVLGPRRAHRKPAASGIFTVYQDNSLVPDLSVAENLYLSRPAGLRPPFSQMSSWAREQPGSLRARSRRRSPHQGPAARHPTARRAREGADRTSEGAPARRANVGARRHRRGHPRAVRAAGGGIGCRRRVHQPPPGRGAGSRRAAHRPARRRDPGNLLDQGSRGPRTSSPSWSATRSRSSSRRSAEASPDADGRPLGRQSSSGPGFRLPSLESAEGEVVGLAGAEGNGQETCCAPSEGSPSPVATWRATATRSISGSVHHALANGVLFLSGDRARDSVFPVLGVRQNMGIHVLHQFTRAGLISGRHGAGSGQHRRRATRRRHPVDRSAHSLPLGREPAEGRGRAAPSCSLPESLLIDEPTQGVDARARLQIYRALREKAEQGIAIVVNSSDALELAGLCDRVLVVLAGPGGEGAARRRAHRGEHRRELRPGDDVAARVRAGRGGRSCTSTSRFVDSAAPFAPTGSRSSL